MYIKRLLSIALALCLLAGCALATEVETADYTTAGKLVKQLWAGSGFSGTLGLEITPKEGAAGSVLSTKQPIEAALDYIYVRATDEDTDEHRVDISIEGAQTVAHISLKDGALAFQSDVTGDGWYRLPAGAGVRSDGVSAAPSIAQLDSLKLGAEDLLARTGLPALAAYLLPAVLRASGRSQELSDLSAGYITRVDLWIEGFRQSAVLGKLDDGTTTITTQYLIPPAAIKAQAKQMVLTLLNDSATLAKLASILGDSDAALLLEPKLQSYYFDAIDALPLEGDMAIERSVSLKGDTLGLSISLPLYDAKGGAATLGYERTRGEGDLPDDNVISLVSESRELAFKYQTYESMADVTVWQGTLLSRAAGAGSFSVGEQDEAADADNRALSAAFSLTLNTVTGRDSDDRDTLSYKATLTLKPDTSSVQEGEIIAFEPLEITLQANFASKTLKTASTEIDATLIVDGESRPSVIKLSLAGKTRKKWTPEPVPETAVSISDMSTAELMAMLPDVVTRGGMLLTTYINLPTADAEPEEGALEPTPTAEPGATPTPVIFETLAPGQTPNS